MSRPVTLKGRTIGQAVRLPDGITSYDCNGCGRSCLSAEGLRLHAELVHG